MINFMKIKSRVAAVEKELENGGDLAKMYADNYKKWNECSIEEDEEYETLTEINLFLREKIINAYMDQNGYRKNRKCNYERK